MGIKNRSLCSVRFEFVTSISVTLICSMGLFSLLCSVGLLCLFSPMTFPPASCGIVRLVSFNWLWSLLKLIHPCQHSSYLLSIFLPQYNDKQWRTSNCFFWQWQRQRALVRLGSQGSIHVVNVALTLHRLLTRRVRLWTRKILTELCSFTYVHGLIIRSFNSFFFFFVSV